MSYSEKIDPEKTEIDQVKEVVEKKMLDDLKEQLYDFKETQDRINRYVWEVMMLQKQFEKKYDDEKNRYDLETQKMKRRGETLRIQNRIFSVDIFFRNHKHAAETHILNVLKDDLHRSWSMFFRDLRSAG